MESEFADWPLTVIDLPIILAPGYCVVMSTPGSVNHWRRLYKDFNAVPRPLTELVQAEIRARRGYQ